jgi:predicted nucleic acid-binding protein
MESFIWMEVTSSIADRAGEFANRFERSHRHIDVVDCVIAATQKELAVPLWTLNVRHFPMIADLEAPY